MSTYASEAVERQMRNWELARSQRLAAPAPEKREVADFICVSRMVGIAGQRVSEKLGKKLGWPVFDREVLEIMAGDDFYRKRIYDLMDERDLSWSGQVVHSFFDSRFVRNDYFHRLCETLLLLARKGPGVYVGRGADLILPADHGFRVRLAAPLEKRVAWLAEERRISPAEARQEIERTERERAQYFRLHFRLETEDPLRYDLTINMERFMPDQVVDMVLAARRIRQGS